MLNMISSTARLLRGATRTARAAEEAGSAAKAAEAAIKATSRGGEVAADVTRASEAARATEGASSAAHAGSAPTHITVEAASNWSTAGGKLADAAKYPAGVLATAFAGNLAYNRFMSGVDRGERMVKEGVGALRGEFDQLALALEHQWDKVPGAVEMLSDLTGSPVLGGIAAVLTVGVVAYVAYETYEYIF